MADVQSALEVSAPEVLLGEIATGAVTRSGSLEVRFAVDAAEIAAAQALRFRVFYEEMNARPDPVSWTTRRDIDPFDDVCDHLLVVDHALPVSEAVVGTYRLLRQDVARECGGFYSAGEYDLTPLIEGPLGTRGLLELGRSCVDPAYRTNATIQLLWRGITRYLAVHDVGVMFGCASFPGTEPKAHDVALSYLFNTRRAPPECRVRAWPGRFVAMDRLPPGGYSLRDAVRALPPLVKGYLRLGAFIGDGAVVDFAFGTTDVFILLPVDPISVRYLEYLDRRSQGAASE